LRKEARAALSRVPVLYGVRPLGEVPLLEGVIRPHVTSGC
jgi:hypothetical protein